MRKVLLGVLGVLIVVCVSLIGYSFAYQPENVHVLAETPSTEIKPYQPIGLGDSFKQINADEFMNIASSADINVIWFGRKECGTCPDFVPAIKEVEALLKNPIYYLDVATVDTSTGNYMAMANMINEISDDYSARTEILYPYIYGITPLVVLTQDYKVVDILMGAKTSTEIKDWLILKGLVAENNAVIPSDNAIN